MIPLPPKCNGPRRGDLGFFGGWASCISRQSEHTRQNLVPLFFPPEIGGEMGLGGEEVFTQRTGKREGRKVEKEMENERNSSFSLSPFCLFMRQLRFCGENER